MENPLWKLTEYPKVLEEFRADCSEDKVLNIALDECLKRLQLRGPQCGMPTSEYLEDGIFQIRPRSQEKQGRVLYYKVQEERKITFLCWFIKKVRKTPRHYIDLAKKRRKELLEPL